MEKGLTGAAILIMQLITQDLKQASLVVVEKCLTEEAVRKIKVNTTIATGKEIQTRIHRGQCGQIIPLVQAVTRAQDGTTVHPIQQEDKVLIGEIVLHEVLLTAAPEVVHLEAGLQGVHHLAAVAVEDHILGVGIKSNNF